MFLIAALGNPGDEYKNTRHNVGFLMADKIAAEKDLSFRRGTFLFCEYCKFDISDERCILIKPQTYMNDSGRAVKAVLDYYEIPISNLIVICDDINLEPGQIRIRRQGSAGGHNGLKSIIDNIKTDNFKRIKIGVGDRENPDFDLADFVLSKFSKEENNKIEDVSNEVNTSVSLIVDGKIEEAMNRFNS